MADKSGMNDYLELSLRSIHNVNTLVSRGALELNGSLCKNIINNELQVLQDFLLRNLEKLPFKDIAHDRRRVALLQLYPVVKQAENLVEHCCERNDSTWPERALSVFAIKEDALDILLHLRWWTSVLKIAIDSAASEQPNFPSTDHSDLYHLVDANQEFEDMLNVMALFDMMEHSSSTQNTQRKGSIESGILKETLERIMAHHRTSYTGEPGTKEHLEFILSWDNDESDSIRRARGIMLQRFDQYGRFKDILIKCIELQNAAMEDRQHLVKKALEVMESYTGTDQSGSREHRVYLLANQVHSLLTDVEVDGIPELNEFKHVCNIGMGAFGIVQRATWCGFDCVLKQIFIDPNDPQDQNEAKRLKRFAHPHIVKFYRHFMASPNGTKHLAPQSHIVMEQMPLDLAQHMKNLKGKNPSSSGSSSSSSSSSSSNSSSNSSSSSSSSRVVPFSEQVTVDIMQQLAKAMWHMHSKLIVHRDLKPGNVLVRQVSEEEVPELFAQGYVQVKLGDFGLVREQMLTAHSELLMSLKAGTTLYRAPELSSPNFTVVKVGNVEKKMVEIKYPHKADLWSFGIMASEILTGEMPYGEDVQISALLADIQNGVRPRIPETCPDYLKFIIESCWEHEPLERPRFSDVWRMLRIAKLRSLGLIDHKYDWFWFKVRNDNSVTVSKRKAPLESLSHSQSGPSRPAQISSEGTPTGLATSSKTKPAKWTLSFLMPMFLKFNIFGGPHGNPNPGVDIHIPSFHKEQFGYLTNMVWPRERASDWKLDVIFFEGNVGGRKHLSCRDTWLQRNQPKVFWPKDWLPQDVGEDMVRVLVLEYCISETGLEGLVSDINGSLIFSERWNQNRTWQRPIVLVGHSLGCTVIEALVLDLDRNARRLHEDTISDYDRTKAETSRAFLSSLKGCFFYAHPSNGLIRSHSLLREVFGGLTYSGEQFPLEFCDERLQKRSSDFLKLTQTRKHISLMSLMEGYHTRGRFVVRRVLLQPEDVLKIGHTLVLEDSNHIETCKPVDRKHASYQELVKFLKILYETKDQ